MGGGLNFLNKKTWHPARPQNLEEVWKREQKAAAESKKAEELRKQLEEERKRSEYVQMAMDTGHLRKEERLDWMYGSGLQAKQDAEKRREDMLTGKAEVVLAPEQQAHETSRAEQVALLPSFYGSTTPASQNETWIRLNNDPLFAIKRQQQEQLSKLRENPIKMMELLKNLTKAKERKGKDKEVRKKEKKEKRSKKRERGSDNHSTGDEDSDRAPKLRSPPALISYGSERAVLARGRHEHGQDHAYGYQQPQAAACARPSSSREEDVSGRSYGRPAARAVYSERAQGNSGDRERHDRGRMHEREPERRYDGHTEHLHRRGDRYDGHRDLRASVSSGPGDGQRHEGHDLEGAYDWNNSQDQDRQRGSNMDHKRVQCEDRERRRNDEERQDSRGAHLGTSPLRRYEGKHLDDRYGLKHSSMAPRSIVGADNSNFAAETRARLEQAKRAREDEEHAKAAQRYVRKDYKTGQMTEEERQLRLAEMLGNAQEHEQLRRRRLEAAAVADTEQGENDRLVSHANATRGSDAFRDAAAKDVYSKLQGSLEARVSSRRHFSSR